MSPSAEKVQCPFCFGHVRTKEDGTMYLHDRGRRGMRKRCAGSRKTKDEAKAAKALGARGVEETSDRPDEVRPEDIF